MEYIDELYKNNYACTFTPKSIHLGFLLNTSNYDNLGFDYDGKNYVPVITFEEEGVFFVEEWTGNKYEERPKYIVFFKGNDDTSYGLRFESREDRQRFLNDHAGDNSIFSEFIRSKCLTYN